MAVHALERTRGRAQRPRALSLRAGGSEPRVLIDLDYRVAHADGLRATGIDGRVGIVVERRADDVRPAVSRAKRLWPHGAARALPASAQCPAGGRWAA